MVFFSIIGVSVSIYYLVRVFLWIVLDCDIELFIKLWRGEPISALRGKVIWITGASSGIGKCLALILAAEGVKLVLSSIDARELEEVKKDCLAMANDMIEDDDILILNMDMLAYKEHAFFFEQVIRHFHRLDILVNNAGRSQRAAWCDISVAVDREVFELNVFSLVHLSRIAVDYYTANGYEGHIAVTCSAAGLIGVPYSASYTGAKHAIRGYFEALRNEDPPVDITIFCPGPTATNFLLNAFTGNIGEKYGKCMNSKKGRLSCERCAYLYGIALANKTQLSWVGVFPMSLILYIGCYYPNVKNFLQNMIGTNRIAKIRDGR